MSVGAAVEEAFYRQLRLRAATIDELLNGAFAPASAETGDADLTARRLAAWCRASAAGDNTLFARRLERDGITPAEVRERLSTARFANAAAPAWLDDAVWVETALRGSAEDAKPIAAADPCAFEDLLLPVVQRAALALWDGAGAAAAGCFTGAGRACLSLSLLRDLSELCAPALYERFAKARNAGRAGYAQFAAEMKASGFRHLFEDKPVLLRVMATVARQWIDMSREFACRLAADLPEIRREFLQSSAASRVESIEGGVSDPHNGGRSVLIIRFEDGARVVYKPKDLRLDLAWQALIGRLNRADPPVTLKAVRAVARDGYGWTEFIDHAPCRSPDDFSRFFQRAGAWLALLHVFVATDMHQENMIACGDDPIPVDLETILQPSAEEHKIGEPEGEAFDAAMAVIANSVMTVGLLPAYGRSADNQVFAMGGLTADWGARTVIKWNAINSDAMRPARAQEAGAVNTNLPHSGGRYAKFADHIDAFVSGFADYAKFLSLRMRITHDAFFFDGFAGVPVRRVIRPTRFYYMLLRRLKDHRHMDDGAIWSAQADFVARLADWDKASDPLWPLQQAERAALLTLNVPHFTSPSDGCAISDASGASVQTAAAPGLARAQKRAQMLDDKEIAWQIEIIKENTNSLLPPAPHVEQLPSSSAKALVDEVPGTPSKALFIAEADRIAKEIEQRAIRRGTGAAWIGLDWLGDSDVFQLVCLGPDLYNGVSGIAFFLAAHAAITGNAASQELARAGIAQLCKHLKSRNAPRMARTLGIGGATGLGSIVYALAVMAKFLGNDELLAETCAATRQFTDELIAADRQLDVMGGSAGAILGLLRLHRDTRSEEVLDRAVKCGEHLLAARRVGTENHRSWIGQGFASKAHAQGLTGMSHGAAGFAYALASLAEVSGRDEFAVAASECITFEDSTYDASRHNWPDLRAAEPHWPCQWCHGAPGIGLARLGMKKYGGKAVTKDAGRLTTDIRNAAAGVERASPGAIDTLCCGTLGRIEFMCEASGVLERGDLRQLAARRLMTVVQHAAAIGDYRWNSGQGRFNLGLFRGLSGVGYTLLRHALLLDGNTSLPNVLIWE